MDAAAWPWAREFAKKTHRGRTGGPTIIVQGGRGEGGRFFVAECRGGGEEKNDKTITSVSDGFVFVVNKNKPVTNTFDPRNRPWWMHWFETSVKQLTRTFFAPL